MLKWHRRIAPIPRPAGAARRPEARRNRLTTPRPSSPRSRARWKEAAAGDVLAAQLELKRGQRRSRTSSTSTRPSRKTRPTRSCSTGKLSLTADPDRLPRRRRGSLEAIIRDKPIKRSIPTATLTWPPPSGPGERHVEDGAFDDAIRQFQQLRTAIKRHTFFETTAGS